MTFLLYPHQHFSNVYINKVQKKIDITTSDDYYGSYLFSDTQGIIFPEYQHFFDSYSKLQKLGVDDESGNNFLQLFDTCSTYKFLNQYVISLDYHDLSTIKTSPSLFQN